MKPLKWQKNNLKLSISSCGYEIEPNINDKKEGELEKRARSIKAKGGLTNLLWNC